MSESGSQQHEGGGPSGGRRHSLLTDFIPDELPLPPSFIPTAPHVREILSKDIEECSSPEGSDHTGSDDDETLQGPSSAAGDQISRRSSHATSAFLKSQDAKLAFHPNGVVYGCGYSAIAPAGLDRPVPNQHEIEQSMHEEVELLRDNDLLPPSSKSHRRHSRGGSLVDSLYRHVFSTKVRDHEDRDSQDHIQQQPSPVIWNSAYETTPLLQRDHGVPDDDDRPDTPPPEVVAERFEEAVAAHCIKTTWQREAKTLIRYSAPLIATFLLHYSVTIGSVLTVGRLGMVELAAVNCKSRVSTFTPFYP